MKKSIQIVILMVLGLIIIVASVIGGAVSERLFGYKILDKYWPKNNQSSIISNQFVMTEENAVIDVVDKVGLSVVTVAMGQDIGSGFIITKDGLLVTNKHVVANTRGKYQVIDKDDKSYDVVKIYRDPINDLAILKIEGQFSSLEMGDSSKLKVGQFVVAIGTALGEFRHTVTTGVISGLGRDIDIEKGSFIQTDAAINPGNSGGPLLNSAGQVIGVNTAVAGGQNIGFAIPINVIKDAIDNFNNTGQFSRPYLGVKYKIIDKKLAILNDVPEGAYVQEIGKDSPAEKSGLLLEDIITVPKDVAKEVATHKIGDSLDLEVWRNGKILKLIATLEEAK